MKGSLSSMKTNVDFLTKPPVCVTHNSILQKVTNLASLMHVCCFQQNLLGFLIISMKEIYSLLIAAVVDLLFIAKMKIYCTLFVYLVTKNSTVPQFNN